MFIIFPSFDAYKQNIKCSLSRPFITKFVPVNDMTFYKNSNVDDKSCLCFVLKKLLNGKDECLIDDAWQIDDVLYY